MLVIPAELMSLKSFEPPVVKFVGADGPVMNDLIVDPHADPFASTPVIPVVPFKLSQLGGDVQFPAPGFGPGSPLSWKTVIGETNEPVATSTTPALAKAKSVQHASKTFFPFLRLITLFLLLLVAAPLGRT